ncbi:MAG: cupin domain-containing protein [candidate division KSB1 bacterium]|nr:cupin domain-containing protein [candidate division KSB1 bacterium]
MMLIKREKNCTEIIANDGCRLRELLHPERDAADISYSLAIAHLDPGKSTYAHYLRQTEVYYIIQGIGRLHIGDEVADGREGDTIVIPVEQKQWLENIGQNVLVFAAIVSPPWRAQDDIRV